MPNIAVIFTYCLMIIPIAAFTFHILANIFKYKWYERLSKKVIRMLYYLIMLIWFVSVFLIYNKKILAIGIFKEYVVINREACNVLLYILAALIITLIWDMLFISCKSIKSLKYKDTEISLEEAEDIKQATIAKNQDIEFLYEIIRIKYVLICEMENYVDNLDFFDENMYITLMKKYAEMRKAKRFECFHYDFDGLKRFREKYRYTEADFSKVMFNLDFNGVCVPESKDEHIFYAVIKTMYSEKDLIITLHSGRILFDEHLIIQNIITVMDLYVTIRCKDVELLDLLEPTVDKEKNV